MQKMNILLVDDKGGPYILDTIRCLSYKQDVNIYVVSPERKEYFNTIPYSRYVKKYEYLNFKSKKEEIEKINVKIREWKIDVVLPVKQSNYTFFASLNGEFDRSLLPPQSTKETLEIVSDKWLLFNWLKEHSFPTPKSYLVSEETLQSIIFPILLKPKLDTNGNKVKMIKSADTYLETTKENNFNKEDFILQENIYGEDIDISLLAKNGIIKAYTIQKGLVREALSFATGIEFIDNNELLKQTEAIIKKLNWNGIAHLDFVHDPKSNSYHLIDFNPRLWSTLIGSLYAGVNFPILMVKLAQNQTIDFIGYRKTQFYLAQQALQQGKLKSIKNSSWKYVLNDPLPEIVKAYKKLSSIIKLK